MVQSPSSEANWFAASQGIPRISRNPKVHYRTHKRPPPFSILGPPIESLFACCPMLPLEIFPPPGIPSGGEVYLRIVLSPEQASACLNMQAAYWAVCVGRYTSNKT